MEKYIYSSDPLNRCGNLFWGFGSSGDYGKNESIHGTISAEGCCYVGWSIYVFSKQDTIEQADVALVFGASVYRDEPSPVFAARINHGVWSYQVSGESHLHKLNM